MIISFPDANKVKPQHRNKILLSNYFTMKEGITDKNQLEERIMLKQFPTYIYSIDRQAFLDNKLSQSVHVMPLVDFDINITDYENTQRFHSKNKQDNWIDLPLSEQVMVYYTKAESVGCQHYIRGCEYKCSTCNEYFGCRLCHDEEVDDHQFDRKKTEEVRCRYCDHEQKFGQSCEKCGVEFGWYICYQCKMICGLGQDAKPNYHCDGCGICMVGLQQFAKHCYKCNGCFNVDFFDEHKCYKPEGNCCVCLDDMTKTIYGRVSLDCGHQVHEHCYHQLIQQQNYKCPICRKFLPVHEDQKRITDFQKRVYQFIFIPYNFLDNYVLIQCNDCESKFTRNLHPYAYYCDKCDRFNCDKIGESFKDQFLEQQPSKIQPLLPDFDGIHRYIINLYGSTIKQQQNLSSDEEVINFFLQFINFNKQNQLHVLGFIQVASKHFDTNIDTFKQEYDLFITEHAVIYKNLFQ